MSGPAVVTCQLCGGSGDAPGRTADVELVCGTCTGMGSVVVYLSPEDKPVACARCGGKGRAAGDQNCPSCQGCGWVGRL